MITRGEEVRILKQIFFFLWTTSLCSAQYYGPKYDTSSSSDGYKVHQGERPQPYNFGYDVKGDYGSTLNHKEESDSYGYKKGSYGYTDGYGIYRQVDYTADDKGFRAVIKTNEPGTANENPADIKIYSDAKPTHYSPATKDKSYSGASYYPKDYSSDLSYGKKESTIYSKGDSKHNSDSKRPRHYEYGQQSHYPSQSKTYPSSTVQNTHISAEIRDYSKTQSYKPPQNIHSAPNSGISNTYPVNPAYQTINPDSRSEYSQSPTSYMKYKKSEDRCIHDSKASEEYPKTSTYPQPSVPSYKAAPIKMNTYSRPPTYLTMTTKKPIYQASLTFNKTPSNLKTSPYSPTPYSTKTQYETDYMKKELEQARSYSPISTHQKYPVADSKKSLERIIPHYESPRSPVYSQNQSSKKYASDDLTITTSSQQSQKYIQQENYQEKPQVSYYPSQPRTPIYSSSSDLQHKAVSCPNCAPY